MKIKVSDIFRLTFMLLPIILTFSPVHAQGFEQFVQSLNDTDIDKRQDQIDQYLSDQTNFPIIEGTSAHIVYNGPLKSMSIAGDFTGWNPANGIMTQIEGTRFWYRSFTFDKAARLQYKLVSQNQDWIHDPLNKLTTTDGNDNSELRMPDYREPEIIQEKTTSLKGAVSHSKIFSDFLNMERSFAVYTPSQYTESQSAYPVVFVNDGYAYLEKSKMATILDNMISDGMIRPVIAVFVPPVDRTPEYVDSLQDDYTRFLSNELFPYISENFRITKESKDHAIIGSSYGGNISFWVGIQHPEVFGNIGAFSPYIEKEILDFFSSRPALDTKIYINHGFYDHLKPIHESVKAILPILVEKKYTYQYGQYPESHNYGFWRAYLKDVLRFFFDN